MKPNVNLDNKMSGNLYRWRKKKKSLEPLLPAFFHDAIVTERKRTSQQCGKNATHGKRWASVTPGVHTTQGGLKTLTLKRVKVTASSRLLLNVPEHLAAVPELNCVYVCTCKVKTCLKTMLATFLG